MIPCRECKKEISSEAKTCPHCGIGSPQRSLLSRRFGDLPLLTRLAIVFIGAPIFLGVIINLFSPSTPDSSSSPPPLPAASNSSASTPSAHAIPTTAEPKKISSLAEARKAAIGAWIATSPGMPRYKMVFKPHGGFRNYKETAGGWKLIPSTSKFRWKPFTGNYLDTGNRYYGVFADPLVLCFTFKDSDHLVSYQATGEAQNILMAAMTGGGPLPNKPLPENESATVVMKLSRIKD